MHATFNGRFFIVPLVIVMIVCVSGFARTEGDAPPDVKKQAECPFCGMDRAKFAHSRMLIRYDDGAETGTCSLHCAAVDLANHLDKTPVDIHVGDFFSKALIDAESAFWVIGGKKPGVMTRRGKWAFAREADARRFIKENGGELANFEAAVAAAYEDMYQDTRMIREKRKEKRQKAEAVPSAPAVLPPPPSTSAKCPVCGMFVAKYPDWVGVITFNDGATDYFDGAKDLFKYYFDVESYRSGKSVSDIRSIHVTEYYNLTLIDAKSAFFVIGSDVYGPMGRELIPFLTREDAEAFKGDHGGKRIVTFDQVDPALIKTLD